jgi:carbonic anhydrase
MTSQDPILPAALAAGYARFRAGRYAAEHDRYRELGSGAQQPRTIVIACSDSRAAPETIFDARPGELFVVRNVAALVPVYEPDGHSHAASAALEYGVVVLAARSIVVMGHGRCGGIAAALEAGSPLTSTDFIGTWVAGIRDLARGLGPGTPADPAGRHLALERASIEQSIANVRTFPWIRSREAAGALRIHGAWFDIALGELHALAADGWSPVPGA